MASTIMNAPAQTESTSPTADKYRGATVEDLDPPSALSCNPSTPVSVALMSALERDYTHLTVISQENRALLGYLSIPRLQSQLDSGAVQPTDKVEKAMTDFRKRERRQAYRMITKDTPLAELEQFFDIEDEAGNRHEFAIVTDPDRRFVIGVATRGDLEEFTRRRPSI